MSTAVVTVASEPKTIFHDREAFQRFTPHSPVPSEALSALPWRTCSTCLGIRKQATRHFYTHLTYIRVTCITTAEKANSALVSHCPDVNQSGGRSSVQMCNLFMTKPSKM